MRYSKAALLVFGGGVLLGLLVVVGEIRWLGRVASGAMALGIIALPVALIADVRRRLSLPRTTSRARPSRRHARRTRPRRSAGPRR